MRDVIWRRLSWRKRLAFQASRFCPPRWRFPLFSLPAPPPAQPEPVAAEVPDNLYRLPLGTACHQGAHLDAAQRIVPSLSHGTHGPIEERFVVGQRFFPRVAGVHGTLGSLVFDGDLNYFHWLMETIPRWRFLQEREASLSGIYACQKYPFHRESLRLLGVKPELIHDSSTIPYLRAENILVSRPVHWREPWIVPWLRERLLTDPGASPIPSKHRRIYISRRAATSRGVSNEAELLPLLAEFGFSSIVLEELPWTGQISLFQEAEAVVAPHGAGLTNLIFCTSPTLVVEMAPEGLDGPFYEEISAALRLDYHMLRCDAEGTGELHARSMVVDAGKLRNLLKSRLG
jgi:hypothetical protein